MTTNWTNLETSPSIDTEINAYEVARGIIYALYALVGAVGVAAAVNAFVYCCKKQNKAIVAVAVTSGSVEHETNGIVDAVVVEVPEKQEDFS